MSGCCGPRQSQNGNDSEVVPARFSGQHNRLGSRFFGMFAGMASQIAEHSGFLARKSPARSRVAIS
jgi:hypothetical protein